MTRKYIGIDIDRHTVRMAVLEGERGDPSLQKLAERSFEDEDGLRKALAELLEEAGPGGRMGAALPADQAFVRWLRFPFGEPKKIEAALNFELASRIPVDIEEVVVDYQEPVAGEETFRVCAAAVRKEAVRRLLEAFPLPAQQPHSLDLTPFALAEGARETFSEGILVHLGQAGASVSLILAGRVADYRLMPMTGEPDSEELAAALSRLGTALERGAKQEDLSWWLVGPGAVPKVLAELKENGVPAEVPELIPAEEGQGAAYLPALLLARRLAARGRSKPFEFRRGEFALESQWSGVRRQLVGIGILLTLVLATVAGSAYYNYAAKARRAEALKQEVTEIFRQTFPQVRTIVDVPLQMRNRMKEVQEKARVLGLGGRGSALEVLKAVAEHTPSEVTVDIREFSYTAEELRLEGYTDSFDAINRMAKGLEESELIRETQIANAKMSIDGSRVDFRLNLALAPPEEGR